MRFPWPFRMLAVLVLLPCAIGPAVAADDTSQTERGFVLINQTDQEIDQAEVTSTQGKVQQVARPNPIGPRQRLRVRMTAQQCVASVAVRLHDGRQLRADNLNDCREPLLIVTAGGITTATEAR